jgi:hypothetical protein
VTAGDHPAFTRCASDGECVDGTFCDPPSQVCLPICSHDPVCASGGVCVEAATDQSGTTFVTGMKVCTANCNPETGSPCDPIFGTMACIPFYVENGTSHFHCWQGGHLPLGSPCSDITECAPGGVCHDAGSGASCSAWCTPPGSTCAGGRCGIFAPPHQYDGNEYGICF